MAQSRLDQLQELLREDPQDNFLLFALAQEYEKGEYFAEAIQQYETLRKEHADYVGTYYHLAKLYVRQSDYQKAMEVYGEGILVAQQQGDRHALSELMAAKNLLEEELDA